jgi:hypothetical protein
MKLENCAVKDATTNANLKKWNKTNICQFAIAILADDFFYEI